MAGKAYTDEEKAKNTIHLKGLLEQLPPFCYTYFRGISQTTSVKTRMGYAYGDLSVLSSTYCLEYSFGFFPFVIAVKLVILSNFGELPVASVFMNATRKCLPTNFGAITAILIPPVHRLSGTQYDT